MSRKYEERLPPVTGSVRTSSLSIPRSFLLSTTETIPHNQINSDGDDALGGGGLVPVGSIDTQLWGVRTDLHILW